MMESMKDWLKTKCQSAGSLLSTEVDRGCSAASSHSPTFSNIVVTPQNIPEFTIPRSGENSPRGKESPESEGQSQSSGSLPCSAHNSPGHWSSSSWRRETSPHLLIPSPTWKSKSVPVSPERHMDKLFRNTMSCEAVGKPETTNSDPLSLAAMGLPHLKIKTKFGFETLSESPHTRRKESLFHIESDISPIMSPRRSQQETNFSVDALNIGLRIPADFAEVESRLNVCRRNKRRNVPALIAPLGVVLTPSAQGGEGLVHVALFTSASDAKPPYASCPEIPMVSPEARRKLSDNAVYRSRGTSVISRPPGDRPCRRNSLHDELCVTDGSSAEPSLRRSSGNLQVNPTKELDQFWALSKTVSSSTVSSEPSSSCSCHSISRGDLPPSADLGEVKFSLTYLPNVRHLKVHIHHADNLGGSGRPGHNLNPFVKVCLMPGKHQKQTSVVMRHTKTPVFNQEFLFSDLTIEQLHDMTLRLKFFHKSSKLGRDDPLGTTQVSLDSFDLLKETQMWKALESGSIRQPPTVEETQGVHNDWPVFHCGEANTNIDVMNHFDHWVGGSFTVQEHGYLQLSVCFYASTERMTVCIHQVTDLLKHPFTGAPDPYVKVQLRQPGRPDCKVQTKTKKKSTNPTFNESFTFPISPRIEDLKYTAMTVTLYDHETIRADDVIGQVQLGYGATEDSEFDHWNQVLQNPGRTVTNWHLLMEATQP